MATFFGQPEAAAPEQAPEVETPEVQPQDEPTETPTEQADDASELFEVDGVEYQLPKDLKAKISEWKEGHLRRDDYTRKTQETSALFQHANAMAEAMHQYSEFEKSYAQDREALAQIKHQIAQYNDVNWGGLQMEQYIPLKAQLDSLKEQAQEYERGIEGKRAEFAKSAEKRRAEVLEAGHKYLRHTVPGWGEAHQVDAVKAAKEVGYSDDELRASVDPRQVRLAWKAAQYDKLIASKASAVATAKKAPPVVKPGAVNSSVADQKSKDLRARFKKSGDPQDAARYLLSKGF